MFQNLKVSTRLFMGFGIVILIMVGIVVTSVTQMGVMDTAVSNVNRSSQNIEDAQRVLDVLARPVHVAHGGIHDAHLRYARDDDADHDQDDDPESHEQASRYFQVLKHGLAP